jgi:hypothetical protein
MSFIFRYAIDCPLCQSTYGFGKAFVIATSPEDAKRLIAANHPACPLCKESWEGFTVEVGLFGGGVRDAT